MLTPAGVESILAGQTSLIVGALVIAGLTRPEWWGLAAVVKPQSLIALPFTGEWRKLAIAAAIATALVILSTTVWGLHVWFKWFGFLDDFQALIETKSLGSIALPGLPYPIRAKLGAACVWATRSADLLDRYADLVCGSALIAPYMLGYDLAGLSIAAMVMLLDRERSIARWVSAGWVVAGIVPSIGVVALVGVLIWEGRRLSR